MKQFIKIFFSITVLMLFAMSAQSQDIKIDNLENGEINDSSVMVMGEYNTTRYQKYRKYLTKKIRFDSLQGYFNILRTPSGNVAGVDSAVLLTSHIMKIDNGVKTVLGDNTHFNGLSFISSYGAHDFDIDTMLFSNYITRNTLHESQISSLADAFMGQLSYLHFGKGYLGDSVSVETRAMSTDRNIRVEYRGNSTTTDNRNFQYLSTNMNRNYYSDGLYLEKPRYVINTSKFNDRTAITQEMWAAKASDSTHTSNFAQALSYNLTLRGHTIDSMPTGHFNISIREDNTKGLFPKSIYSIGYNRYGGGITAYQKGEFKIGKGYYNINHPDMSKAAYNSIALNTNNNPTLAFQINIDTLNSISDVKSAIIDFQYLTKTGTLANYNNSEPIAIVQFQNLETSTNYRDTVTVHNNTMIKNKPLLAFRNKDGMDIGTYNDLIVLHNDSTDINNLLNANAGLKLAQLSYTPSNSTDLQAEVATAEIGTMWQLNVSGSWYLVTKISATKLARTAFAEW